ncbi:MAG: ABC transporter ATP-binding protein [Candidatus Omnitrophota bacterium]
MRYLFEYFRHFKAFVGRKVYYLFFLMLIAGFIEAVSITLFLPILQNGFGSDKLSKALKVILDFFHIGFSFSLFLLLILVFFIFRAAFLIFYEYYSGKVTSSLLIALRRKLVEDVFSADYLYIIKKEVGYINNAVVREIACIVEAFQTFLQVLKYTILAAVYIALSMILSFKISLVVLVICPVIIICTMKLNRLTNKLSLAYSVSYGKFNSILFQALSKFKYLKATFSSQRISKIIDAQNKNLGDIRFKLVLLQSISTNAFEPMVVFFVAGLLFYYVVGLGRSVNEIIFLIFLFLQAARGFLTLQSSYRRFLASKGSIDIYKEFQGELEKNRESLNLEGFKPDFSKEILIVDATVIFPNGKKALDNVSITIKPKSVVALVGHSGSGKSTIANMITGILKPASGEILFGDVSYDKINLKILRENVGYVTQEDIIFNASIKDNVSLWGENIDENRLSRAIAMAHIRGFVSDLVEKEDALLGDNGLDVSGGQRQRITIARELYRDTRLLILDEATSSLDSKSENQIYENLKGLKGEKTLVVIAHRLSTIRNADYIYVLDSGRVIEEGTYGDLYEKKGEFKTMIEEQKLV